MTAKGAQSRLLCLLIFSLLACSKDLSHDVGVDPMPVAPPPPALVTETNACRQRLTNLKLTPLSFDEILGCFDQIPRSDWEPLLREGRLAAANDKLHRAKVEHYASLFRKRRGEYHRALDLGRASSAAFEQLGEIRWQTASLHNQGTLYSALGRGREAIASLEEALALSRQLGDSEQEGATLTQMGWVFFLTGEIDRALEYYEAALEKRSTPRGRAVTLDRLGSAYRDSGRPVDALACYREALAIFQNDDPTRAHVLANLGWLHLEGENPDGAEKQLQAALPLLQQVGDRDAEAHVLIGLARVARYRGAFDEALAGLEKALRIVDQLRRTAPTRSLRSTFLALRQDYFIEHLDLLFEMHQHEPGRGYDRRAFLAAERRRARALLDLLAGSRPKKAPNREQDERYHYLQGRLTELEMSLYGASIKRSTDKHIVHERQLLKRQLNEAVTEYQILRATSLGDHEAPYPPQLLTEVDEVQELLDEESSVLSYSLGEERSFLFFLDRETFEIVHLPPRREIERVARDYYELARTSNTAMAENQVWQVGAALGRMLLEPVAERLRRRVIVVKDGELHLVPFAAIPVPDHGGRPLVVGHEVTISPSLSILMLLENRRPTAGRLGLAAIVAPDAGGGRSRDSERFPPLRSVDGEVRSIFERAKRASSLLLLGNEATRERLLTASLSSYNILHFATHAYLVRAFPELSAIVLSDGAGGDDFLRLQEIFDLSIPADLVVLSACETALGDLLRGEGMVGMSHGFLSAGASQVMVSLWPVNDEATAVLMDRFYGALLDEHRTQADALRQAQLALLEDSEGRWSAPYYWAAFEIHGRQGKKLSNILLPPGV